MTKQNERPWGRYDIIKQIKVIKIKPCEEISLQYHNHRDETWEILRGSGLIRVGEDIQLYKEGMGIYIPRGTVHKARALEDGLDILEKSTGKVDEDDIVRLEDKYGRS